MVEKKTPLRIGQVVRTFFFVTFLVEQQPTLCFKDLFYDLRA